MRQRIDDYALLGDCHSAALVGRDGSIDWACFPRFDSPAVFCRILDERRGGAFRVSPEGPFQSTRSYLDDTNVLVTTFTTPAGVLEVTDCMPIRPARARSPRLGTRHSLLRRLRCVGGEVLARVVVAPRFEYGAFVPSIRLTSARTAELVGGADALWVTATHPLTAHENALRARWRLRAGDEAWVEAAWTSSLVERTPEDMPDLAALRQRLAETVAFWRGWISRCAYQGEYAPQVRRSALVLKALTYVPSGAIVAAPTTSLPEEPGGVRNWDYRYTWLRDTSLTLISLMLLGYQEEAIAFRHWLGRTSAGRVEDIQIMYDIAGHRLLPEMELSHLAGHRGSRPVRIGNGAVKQLQLDVFGELLEAAWLFSKMGGQVAPKSWDFLRPAGEWRVRAVAPAGPGAVGGSRRAAPLPPLEAAVLGGVGSGGAHRSGAAISSSGGALGARARAAPANTCCARAAASGGSLSRWARIERMPRCCSCPPWASSRWLTR